MSAYKDLKNHIHNTLEITKDQLRTMVEEAVVKIVERKLEVMFRKYWSIDNSDSDYSLFTMERVIDAAIRDKGRNFWYDSEDNFDDYVKKQVVRELLKGVTLKVEVATNKKDATKTGDGVMIIRKTKKK